MAQWFWMGLLALGALGISDAISVAIRRTVVQILAPDDMRGRATSFLTVFAQTTNASRRGHRRRRRGAARRAERRAGRLLSMHADDYRNLLGDSPAVELSVGLKSLSNGAPGRLS